MTITTAFITGTGFYTLPNIQDIRKQLVETPYGAVEVEIGTLAGREIAFIPRHGKGHTIAPNDINYRANIYALYKLGVQRIFATSVSGSLNPEWGPGTLVLVDQFLTFATTRADTFYPLDGKLAHVDVTDPYCNTLHQHLLTAGKKEGMEFQQGGTYACFPGPRFESRAEIEMARRLGAHLVGQTNYPEVVLARELAMCYATVGIVSNFAAGMQADLTVDEVMDNLKIVGDTLTRIFGEVASALPEEQECTCRQALDKALI